MHWKREWNGWRIRAATWNETKFSEINVKKKRIGTSFFSESFRNRKQYECELNVYVISMMSPGLSSPFYKVEPTKLQKPIRNFTSAVSCLYTFFGRTFPISQVAQFAASRFHAINYIYACNENCIFFFRNSSVHHSFGRSCYTRWTVLVLVVKEPTNSFHTQLNRYSFYKWNP